MVQKVRDLRVARISIVGIAEPLYRAVRDAMGAAPAPFPAIRSIDSNAC